MYASLLLGLGSHKECTNPLLRFYYWKVRRAYVSKAEPPLTPPLTFVRTLCGPQPALFIACAGTELWYMALYALAHVDGPMLAGVPAARLLLYVCTPICAFKQVANAVQMAVACEALVAHDVAKKQ